MKTVFHTLIDGHDIVQGFGDANGLIDPVATAQKLGESVIALPETVAMNNLKTQVIGLRSQAQLLGSKYNAALAAGDQAGANAIAAQINGYAAQATQLEPDLVKAIAAFEAKRSAMFEAAAVYTHPPQGEDLIAEDAMAPLKAAFAAKAEGQALRMDGTFVPDLRGKRFWATDGKAWMKTEIALLGVAAPAGGIEESALSTDQQLAIQAQTEATRVAALSDADRAAEAKAAQASAKAAVVQVQTEVTAGVSTAVDLSAAQAAYKQAIAGIQAKYGVTLA